MRLFQRANAKAMRRLDGTVVEDEFVVSPYTGLRGTFIRWRFLAVLPPDPSQLAFVPIGVLSPEVRIVASGAVGTHLTLGIPGGTIEISPATTTFKLARSSDVGVLVDRPLPPCFANVLAASRSVDGEVYYDEYVFLPGERVLLSVSGIQRRHTEGPFRTSRGATYAVAADGRATVVAGPLLDA